MDIALGPPERYLVVRSREGWSVNLGADVIDTFTSRDGARRAAAKLASDAVADGRRADWLDVAEDKAGPVA